MVGIFWFIFGFLWSFFISYQWWYFACQAKAEYKMTILLDRSFDLIKDDDISRYRRSMVSWGIQKVNTNDIRDDYMKFKDPFAGYPLLFRLEMGV